MEPGSPALQEATREVLVRQLEYHGEQNQSQPALVKPLVCQRDVCVCWSQVMSLCYRMDYSPAGSSVNGILQARILEWIAIPFSRGFS